MFQSDLLFLKLKKRSIMKHSYTIISTYLKGKGMVSLRVDSPVWQPPYTQYMGMCHP